MTDARRSKEELQEFFERVEKAGKLGRMMHLALQSAIYEYADAGVKIKGGPEALKSFPTWCQRVIRKVANTLYRPMGENLRELINDGSPYSHGKSDGLLQRARSDKMSKG